MVFTIDFLEDSTVLEWQSTDDGATAIERTDYTQRLYVGTRGPDEQVDYDRLQTVYENHPNVVRTEVVSRRPGFRRDFEDVLAVKDRLSDVVSTMLDASRTVIYKTSKVLAR